MKVAERLESLQHEIPGTEICKGCECEHLCEEYGCEIIRSATTAFRKAVVVRKALDQLAYGLACLFE